MTRRYTYNENELSNFISDSGTPLEYYRNGTDSFVFTWGKGTDFQLGTNRKVPYLDVPEIIGELTGKLVRDVGCGRSHTIALTQSGSVFAWGTGGNGELGHGKKSSYAVVPQLIDRLRYVFIRKIAVGDHHNLALSDIGRIYSWGQGFNGQLGNDKLNRRFQPSIVESVKDIGFVDIACGAHHSAAITEKGFLYTFGSNESGQLGRSGVYSSQKPILVKSLENVTKVSCGTDHTAAIANHKLYIWGSKEGGKLGIMSQSNVYTPTLVENLELISDVSCGFDHTVCLVRNGDIYVFGSNDAGQLGMENAKKKTRPTKVQSIQGVKKIFAGYKYTIAITEKGKVFIWGNFTGFSSGPTPTLIPFISDDIINIGLGSRHACAIFGRRGTFSFQKLLQNPVLSDFTFVVEDKRFFVHKSIILMRCKCDYFGMIFEEYGNEMHWDISSILLELLLEYIYMDDIREIDEDIASSLFDLAIDFGLERLANICEIVIHYDKYPVVHAPRMIEDILEAYREEDFYDMELVLRKKTYKAHKALLYCRTTYFQTMFEAGMTESEGTMQIKQCSYLIFKKVLDSIYFNLEHEFTGSDVIDTFMAAHRYQAIELRQSSEDFICKNLSDDIIISVLQLSEFFTSEKLHTAAFTYLRANKSCVVNILASEEYLQLNEKTIEEIEAFSHSNKAIYKSKYQRMRNSALEDAEHSYYVLKDDPIMYDEPIPSYLLENEDIHEDIHDSYYLPYNQFQDHYLQTDGTPTFIKHNFADASFESLLIDTEDFPAMGGL